MIRGRRRQKDYAHSVILMVTAGWKWKTTWRCWWDWGKGRREREREIMAKWERIECERSDWMFDANFTRKCITLDENEKRATTHKKLYNYCNCSIWPTSSNSDSPISFFMFLQFNGHSIASDPETVKAQDVAKRRGKY